MRDTVIAGVGKTHLHKSNLHTLEFQLSRKSGMGTQEHEIQYGKAHY